MSETSEAVVPQAWYEVVDKVDSALVCGVCSQAATEPVVHAQSRSTGATCGALLCRACRDLNVLNALPCPKCRDGLFDESMMAATATQLEMLGLLKVRCTGCKTVVVRKDFDSHAQSAKCKFLCPYGCKKRVARSEWSEHDAECVEKLVGCVASDVGCTVRVKRSDLKHHVGSCAYKPLQPYLQRLQAELLAYRTQISNTVTAVNNMYQNFTRMQAEFERQTQDYQRIIKENAALKRQVLEESERYARETKSHMELTRQQRENERKAVEQEVASIRQEIARQSAVNQGLEREMRDFRLSVMTELKRAQVDATDKNKTSFATTLEADWTRREAAKEPLLAGHAVSSAEQLLGFRKLKTLIDELRARLDTLEQRGGAVVQNPSELLSQLGIATADPDALLASLTGMDDYASEAAQDDADTEVDEADMTVEQLAALYPEMSPEELNEYLETKRLLGSLRDQLAAKLGTVNEDAPLPSGEDEVSWALSELERLKQEYEAITAPDAEDSELEAILGAPQRAPKKTGTENLLDTVEALSDELEEAERESRENVAALKPVQYAKTRFALKKAPSQAMLEYLIALPPNTQRPSFTTDEVTKIAAAKPAPATAPVAGTSARPTPPPRPTTLAPTAPPVGPRRAPSALLVSSTTGDGRPAVAVVPLPALRTTEAPSTTLVNDPKKSASKKKDDDKAAKKKADKSKNRLSLLTKALGDKNKAVSSSASPATSAASPSTAPSYIDPFFSGPALPTLQAPTTRQDPTTTPPSSHTPLSSAAPRSPASTGPAQLRALPTSPSQARLTAPARPGTEAPPSPRQQTATSSSSLSTRAPSPSPRPSSSPSPSVPATSATAIASAAKPKEKDDDDASAQAPLTSATLDSLATSSPALDLQADIDAALGGAPVSPPLVVSLTNMSDKPKSLNEGTQSFTTTLKSGDSEPVATPAAALATAAPTTSGPAPTSAVASAPTATSSSSTTPSPTSAALPAAYSATSAPLYRAPSTLNVTPPLYTPGTTGGSATSAPMSYSSTSQPSSSATPTPTTTSASASTTNAGYPPGYSPSTPLSNLNLGPARSSASSLGGTTGPSYPPGYSPVTVSPASPSMYGVSSLTTLATATPAYSTQPGAYATPPSGAPLYPSGGLSSPSLYPTATPGYGGTQGYSSGNLASPVPPTSYSGAQAPGYGYPAPPY